MTPYEIDVLLYYYCRADDHPDIERRPPVWQPTIDSFIAKGLLVSANAVPPARHPQSYTVTPRGKAYAAALMRVELPVEVWVDPAVAKEIEKLKNTFGVKA